MSLLLAFFEFLVLGVLPTELLPAPLALALVLVTIGAAITWYVLHGAGTGFAKDTATGAGHAMRRRSARAPVSALRDPDADGHPRPRAPGAALPAAR